MRGAIAISGWIIGLSLLGALMLGVWIATLDGEGTDDDSDAESGEERE